MELRSTVAERIGAAIMMFGLQTSVAHAENFAFALNGVDVTISGPIKQDELEANEPFYTFVQRIAGELNGQMVGAFGGSEAPALNVEFVYLPLVSNDPDIEQLCAASRCTEVHSRIVSPWLGLSVDATSQPVVNAIVVWNERGFLLDQARINGSVAHDALTEAPLTEAPLTEQEWKQALGTYEKDVLLAASPEARAAALETLSNSMPADLFWLFSHAWQSTLAPFEISVDRDLETFLGLVGPRYAAIVEVLIARGLEESSPAKSYASILDLQPVMDPLTLAVERLH
jgi:hypothetical protein